jgi:hypothetical protein
MISTSCADAFEKTEGREKDLMIAHVNDLITGLKKKNPLIQLSQNGALELLAAIGTLELEVK